jgi:hypothetical protein
MIALLVAGSQELKVSSSISISTAQAKPMIKQIFVLLVPQHYLLLHRQHYPLLPLLRRPFHISHFRKESADTILVFAGSIQLTNAVCWRAKVVLRILTQKRCLDLTV